MEHAWYFAYGSNMQTATLCGRRGIEFVRALPVQAPGWRLVFDKPSLLPIGESFANIIPDPTCDATGVAYELPIGALEILDLTEGVLIGNYERQAVRVVEIGGSGSFEAFTLMSKRRDPTLQPSTRYMALLIEGAIEHGLPAEYVEYLRGVSACEPSATAQAMQPLFDQAMAALRRGR